eukprot:1497585-Alexandrium_andersonii.AAC.1
MAILRPCGCQPQRPGPLRCLGLRPVGAHPGRGRLPTLLPQVGWSLGRRRRLEYRPCRAAERSGGRAYSSIQTWLAEPGF